MKKIDLSQRFGFVVNEVGRLYGRQFDQLSREELGLSRAQEALAKAMDVSDRVQDAALAGFSVTERQQLVAMLQRVRANLQVEAAAPGASS